MGRISWPLTLAAADGGDHSDVYFPVMSSVSDRRVFETLSCVAI